MRYLSVCSGIEAATVAWHQLGWQAVAYSEIDKFPSAVLAHHYPTVPNWGDMTRFQEWPDATVDVLVGGTPCQSFSVAGLRAGLDDPRGSLMLVYLAIARRYRPAWVVWENVPGVLSSDGGRAFGTFLGGLAELGYGFAYRVLDAQYFGVAQRRARVFVVGHLGDWRRAAAVLFERESLSGHPAPRREAGEDTTGTLSSRASAGGGLGTDFDLAGGCVRVAPTLRAGGNTTGGDRPYGTDVDTCDSLLIKGRSERRDVIADGHRRDRPERRPFTPELAPCLTQNYGKQPDNSDTNAGPMLVAFSAKDHGADAGDLAPTLRAGGFTNSHANGGVMPAIAFNWQQGGATALGMGLEGVPPVRAEQTLAVQQGMQVRRLAPRECERLQGFPDDYTLITYRGKPAADGPRYKALGNSMAVTVMAWIGRRIAMVDALEIPEERTA